MGIDTGRAPESAGDVPGAADLEMIEEQSGCPLREVVAVAWCCPCGRPGVIKTLPRLDNGISLPTVYYLANPRYVVACSSLEASGLMTEMTWRLGEDENLAAWYRTVHEVYPADRTALGVVSEIKGIPVGGVPIRVRYLYVLVGHALIVGLGVSPLDDEVLTLVRERINDKYYEK